MFPKRREFEFRRLQRRLMLTQFIQYVIPFSIFIEF